MSKIKDKLYYLLVDKNQLIKMEYDLYVETHYNEHKNQPWKHWMVLFKLNWHYRIMRKTSPLYISKKGKKKVNTKKKSNTKGKSKVKNKPNTIDDLFMKEITKRERFQFVHTLWNTVGVTDELYTHLKMKEQSRCSWENDNPSSFLIYICCLLERGEQKEAKRILIKYLAHIGTKNIHKYMPVANLFVEMGYHDVLIEQSAYIFRQLEKNRENKLFEKLLQGKRVAVVGNGPQEIGTGKGAEIDGHDIIIRFNNFRTKGFEEDYGYRTDIWVRNANIVTEDRDNADELKMILWEPDYWHMNIQHNHLDLLYRDIRLVPEQICYMYGVRKEICTNSNVLNPTTGAQVVYLVEKNKHLLKELNYYGFSFLDAFTDASYEHYYNEKTEAQKIHHPKIEVEFLQHLVFGDECNSLNYLLGNITKQEVRQKVYICLFRKQGSFYDVLNRQQKFLGKRYKNIPIRYLDLPDKITYSKDFLKTIKPLSGKVRIVLQATYFIQNHPQIRKDLANGIAPVLICHDIGTAYGAFLMGLKYVLVYHQRGSILHEMREAGLDSTEEESSLLTKVEKRVLENAEKVYFPNDNAKELLQNTSDSAQNSKKIKYSEEVLYHTISKYSQDSIDYNLLSKQGVSQLDKEGEVFFSYGKFNDENGMEKIPQFLNEYVKQSGKKVTWIVVGSAGAYDYLDELKAQMHTWNFECMFLEKKIGRATLLTLLDYCNYYIMLHHHTVFDEIVLEAMQVGKPLILSDVLGNLDYNVCDNVVYVTENIEESVQQVLKKDYKKWGEANQRAFQERFSQDAFTKRYKFVIDALLRENGFTEEIHSEYNLHTLAKWKNKFVGKCAVICGAGGSLEDYKGDMEAVHIALNQALFSKHISFDLAFIQNAPQNQPEMMEEYKAYSCTKFYGVITNPRLRKPDLCKEFLEVQNEENIVSYELAPAYFDRYMDDISFELDKNYVLDAQSIVFSAIQFAVFSGFKEIVLYGIDFEKVVSDDEEEVKKYALSVEQDLLEFKKAIQQQHPDIVFRIGSTRNEKLEQEFAMIDNRN